MVCWNVIKKALDFTRNRGSIPWGWAPGRFLRSLMGHSWTPSLWNCFTCCFYERINLFEGRAVPAAPNISGTWGFTLHCRFMRTSCVYDQLTATTLLQTKQRSTNEWFESSEAPILSSIRRYRTKLSISFWARGLARVLWWDCLKERRTQVPNFQEVVKYCRPNDHWQS